VAIGKGRAKEAASDTSTAPHQELVRPATDAERRQADALEDIAKSLDRIERALAVHLGTLP
jgi:hypothetical protein